MPESEMTATSRGASISLAKSTHVRGWRAGDSGAHRRRQASSIDLRGAAGRPRVGHRPFAGTAQQSASRHGEHAGDYAVAAAGQGGAGEERGLVLHGGEFAQAAARNASGERYAGGRYRARKDRKSTSLNSSHFGIS